MWFYCWAHVVFHTVRTFAYDNRFKIRILMLIITLMLLVPLIYIICDPHTERYCEQPLFEMLIAAFVFTFCMIGFSILFLLMDPVPREVIFVFQCFGVLCFVFTILLTYYTVQASSCSGSTEYLYYYSIFATAISLILAIIYMIMVPFWIVNRVRRDSVLSLYSGTGVCYSPVKCCPCVWHV